MITTAKTKAGWWKVDGEGEKLKQRGIGRIVNYMTSAIISQVERQYN
jgi:hypothetical protein